MFTATIHLNAKKHPHASATYPRKVRSEILNSQDDLCRITYFGLESDGSL